VGGRRSRGVINGHEFVMLRPDRCTVAKELFWGRGARPDAAEQMALIIFNRLTDDADVLLDIGAYTGLFVLACTATNPNLKAHAFEIFPDAFRLLFDNCAENDILDRVTCHHSGIGIPGTTVVLPNRVRASSLPTSLSSRVDSTEGVEVRFDSLDSVARLIQPAASVAMKIDVEGTENSVFGFGQSFLSQFRPLILCEVLGSSKLSELERLLEPYDYRFFNVSSSGLVPRERIEPNREQRDWLFAVEGLHRVDAYVR
jgi:FkbM family methyltransferase